MRAVAIVALAAALCAGGCGGSGGSQGGPSTTRLDLEVPGDVEDGGRVVYLLADVSCDMREEREKLNRTDALEVGSHVAAFDSGIVVVGVVRELASQNVQFQSRDFDREGSSSRLRVDNALAARDAAIEELRPVVSSAPGQQACQSDLVGALGAVALQHEVVEQRFGRELDADLLYVTNGLIVDQRAGIVLTRTRIDDPAAYRQMLQMIRRTYTIPKLDAFTVWFVGVGYDEEIGSSEQGPAVRRLWADVLEPSGATVKTVVQSAEDVVEPLLRSQE